MPGGARGILIATSSIPPSIDRHCVKHRAGIPLFLLLIQILLLSLSPFLPHPQIHQNPNQNVLNKFDILLRKPFLPGRGQIRLKLLLAVDPKKLRDSKEVDLRENVKDKLERVKATIDRMIISKPGRDISFDGV